MIENIYLKVEDFTVTVTAGDNMLARTYPTRNEAAQAFSAIVAGIKQALNGGML